MLFLTISPPSTPCQVLSVFNHEGRMTGGHMAQRHENACNHHDREIQTDANSLSLT